MSRVAKAPVPVVSGVTITIVGKKLTVKGAKASLDLDLHPDVEVSQNDGEITVKPRRDEKSARALVNNMVVGVSEGFQKTLQLVGVGYRAQARGKVLVLNLGFSHPVDYPVPEGVTVETPSQTEIIVSGADKQRVGQVAAEIRGYRPPEP